MMRAILLRFGREDWLKTHSVLAGRITGARWYHARMSALVLWFLLGQTMASMPEFIEGTELRLVSPDLMTVYSSGRVSDGRLMIDLPLDAGTEIRLLVFPPNVTDGQAAALLSGAQAVFAHVAEERADILLSFPDEVGTVSLREWLRTERGIVLVLVTRR